MTLLVFLNANKDGVLDMYLFSRLNRSRRFRIATDDVWLERGKRLNSLCQFLQEVEAIRQQRRLL